MRFHFKIMSQLKIKIGELVDTRSISTLLALSGITMLVPFFVHLQWITGPFVNAMLIIILFILGIRSALLMCLIPSLMALAAGLLPVVLAPSVPFIMMSNAIYILCIDWIYNNFKENTNGYWWGIFVGSTIKFFFLFVSVNVVSKLVINNELTMKVAQMFSWSQLVTALIGGMIAWLVLKWLKRI